MLPPAPDARTGYDDYMEEIAAISHEPVIEVWREDYKRGAVTPVCSCGWRGGGSRASMTMDGANYEARRAAIIKWRAHLPADHPTSYGICIDDGSVHTGQANVSREGEDYVLSALTTHMTTTALIVLGFEHGDVGNFDEAREYVIPIGHVLSVNSEPWWDIDDLLQRDVEQIPQDVADADHAAQEA